MRTMKYIDSLENDARGVYSGAIGFLGLNGTVDLNIVIRTIVLTKYDASIGTGGAITILSDPDSEFEEIVLKANALIKSLIYSKFGIYDKITEEDIISKTIRSYGSVN